MSKNKNYLIYKLKFFIKKIILNFLRNIFFINNKKILITTIPKSGTHMMKKYVELMCFTQSIGLGEHRIKRSKMREPLKIEDITNIIKNKKNKFIFWGHIFNANKNVKKFFIDNFTIIIIERNPKEIICSYLNTILKNKHTHHYYEYIKNLNAENQINQLIKNFPTFKSKSIFSQIYLQNKFKIHKNCHFFKYEDLVLDKSSYNKKLFWKNIKRLENILEIKSFSKYLSRLLILFFGYNNKGSNYKHLKMFTPKNNIFFKELKNKHVK